MNPILEPALAKMVDEFVAAGRPKASEQSWQARRDGYRASAPLGGEVEDVGTIQEWQEGECRVRLYQPDGAGLDRPALIYFHGGCFVSGDFDTHDRQLRMLCRRAGALVFAVHTRLAPEHPYPAAHDDALAATRAIMGSLATWGGSLERLALAGDSAGGHLALVTALRLASVGATQPSALCLLYPMLDSAGRSDSYRTLGEDYLITADMLQSGFTAYLGPVAYDHPEACPLLHPALPALPPTLILTAEFDPLRDEGEALYHALIEHGVEAACQRQLGVTHGYFQLAAISPAARQLIDQLAGWLRGLSIDRQQGEVI